MLKEAAPLIRQVLNRIMEATGWENLNQGNKESLSQGEYVY